MPLCVVCSYLVNNNYNMKGFFCQVLKSNNQTFFLSLFDIFKVRSSPTVDVFSRLLMYAYTSYSIKIEEKVLFSECDLLCKFSFFCSTTTLSSAFTEAPFPNQTNFTIRFSVDTTLPATVNCFRPFTCLNYFAYRRIISVRK